MKFLFRWLFQAELLDEYMKGVKDGVNQYHHDKDSAMWMVQEE